MEAERKWGQWKREKIICFFPGPTHLPSILTPNIPGEILEFLLPATSTEITKSTSICSHMKVPEIWLL